MQATYCPVTTSRAAKILDVAEGTVRNYERRGWLEAQRTENGTRLFDRAAVERLAEHLKEARGAR